MIDQTPQQANPVSRASLPTAAQRWLDRALPRALPTPKNLQLERMGSVELGAT